MSFTATRAGFRVPMALEGRAVDAPCKDFLVLNIIFAAINTILMGVLVWQLWVVRSRFDRLDFIAGRIIHGVRGVAWQIGRAFEWVRMNR